MKPLAMLIALCALASCARSPTSTPFDAAPPSSSSSSPSRSISLAPARPELPPVVPWRAPIPIVTTLPSGLRVALLRQPGLPLVHVSLIIRAGSALDGPREGLASAVATMLEEGGAGRYSGPALAEAFEALGDQLDIVCDVDFVTLQVDATAPALPAALALLADVLLRPRFAPAEWRRERSRSIAEIASERDQPDKVADRVFDRALFGTHPYGHPAIGSARSVARIESAALRSFYAAHYQPATTTLLLVGDLDEPSAAALAAPFAAWSAARFAGQAAASENVPAPVAPGARLVLVDRPSSTQSEVRVGGLAVARGSADLPAAELLAMVLGGSFTSRLTQNLRERHGYTYDVSAALVARESGGALVVQSAVRADATAAAVREIIAELRGLHAAIQPAELDKARALIEGEIVSGFADGAGASLLLADLLAHHLPADAWSQLPTRLAAIDAAQLALAAARLLDPDRLTIVVVGDRAALEPQLRALPSGATLELRDTNGEPPTSASHP